MKKYIRHGIIILILSVFYVSLCRYTYNKKIKINIVDINPQNNTSVCIGEIKNGDEILQRFVYRKKQIEVLQVLLGTGEGRYEVHPESIFHGILDVEIYNDITGEWLASTCTELDGLKDNSIINIVFDDPVYVEGTNYFKLRITVSGVPDNKTLSFYLSDANVEEVGGAVWNGVEQEHALVLAAVTTESDLFQKACLFAAVVMWILLTASYILLFVIKYKKIHILFLMYAILLGGLYLVFMPEYEAPDEDRHIYTAYDLSNKIMGYGDQGMVMIRQSDKESDYFARFYPRARYNQYVSALLSPEQVDKTLVKSDYFALSAPRYLYIFSAIGITIGRIFGGGFAQICLLGTIFNYIFFIAAVYFAIKKIPVCKTALMLVALLPMAMQQATSFSYDNMLMALTLLMLSYSLHMLYGEGGGKRSEAVLLIVVTALLLPIKSFVYFPVCTVALFPLFKKWQQKDRRLIKPLLSGILLLTFIVGAVLFLLFKSNIQEAFSPVWVRWVGMKSYGLEDILNHPLQILHIYWETVLGQLSSWCIQLLGSPLGNLDIEIPGFIMVLLLFLIIVSAMKKSGESIQMRPVIRIVLLGMVLLSSGLILTAMLLNCTPNGSDIIYGVQGRYFLPLLIFILLALRGDWIKISEDADLYCIGATMLVQPVIFYSVICTM